jgi:hypothetical protein
VREHADREAAPATTPAATRDVVAGAPSAALAGAIGNRRMSRLVAAGAFAPARGPRVPREVARMLRSTSPPQAGAPTSPPPARSPTSPPQARSPTSPPQSGSPTSPPQSGSPEEDALLGAELTSPLFRWPWWIPWHAPAGGGGGGAAPASNPVQEPESLKVRGSGSIKGKFKISEYWPGVGIYWGADKTLGKFDKPLTGHTGWRMIGHKFQVIGKFSTGTTTTGAGGNVTFLQEARITNTKGGTATAWFDDMDYVDASGGAHHWDPNAEVGTAPRTGYPGVRRTISSNEYAYTDPPALSYQPGTTNSYRKLEFRITLRPPPGAAKAAIVKYATQEIEIKKGVPKVLQSP